LSGLKIFIENTKQKSKKRWRWMSFYIKFHYLYYIKFKIKDMNQKKRWRWLSFYITFNYLYYITFKIKDMNQSISRKKIWFR